MQFRDYWRSYMDLGCFSWKTTVKAMMERVRTDMPKISHWSQGGLCRFTFEG